MATRALRRSSRDEPSQPQRPELRVVEGTPRKTAKRRSSPISVVVLVVLAVFGVSALQAWVGQDGLHAASLERDVQREQERLTLLRAQVAQLSSPRRLREEANKLGLVPAADPRFLKASMGPADPGPLSNDATKRLAAPSP